MNNKVLKKKLVLKKKIRITLSKILITIIIFLLGMILIKSKPILKVKITENQ